MVFQRATVTIMEVGNIRLYEDRWKALEEIKQQCGKKQDDNEMVAP